jgi:alpha-beta hydrolase superfamily lysophospholipase
MRHQTGEITTSDGVKLFSQSWLPDSTPKAILAFVHGLGEHSGRYQHVGEAYAKAGYGLQMADLRGHGKSPGQRGHAMSFNDYHIDSHAIIDAARKLAPDAPLFFGGHSLGGLIALSVAEENPPNIKGVVISSPGLRAKFAIPGWKITLGKVFSRIMPTMSMASGLPASEISRDPAVVQAYTSDPLVHGMVSARQGMASIAAGPSVMNNAHLIKLPLLMIHGTEDHLVDPAASREFFDKVSSTDKTYKSYQGLYHEPHNEPEKDQVFSDIIQWMDNHL